MAVQVIDSGLQPLNQGFQAAQRWLWWQTGLVTLARSLCLSLALALIAALLQMWQAPRPLLLDLGVAACLIPLFGAGVAILRRPSTSAAARAVDFRLGLHQQLGTAEELLSRGASGALVSQQIARASALAGEVPIGRAFPLFPRREIALALLLAAPTAVLLVLASLGVTWPNPLSIVRLPSFSKPEATKSVAQDTFRSLWQTDQERARSAALGPVAQALDRLQDQAQKGTLSTSAAAAALSQANAELNRVATESHIRQEALDNLSNQLRGTAAGREAAESLRQGDYNRAAQQLREMGAQSDQLSEAAKQELAQALNRSAASSQKATELATNEAKTADTLRQGDYSSVVQSTDQLAQAVQNAAGQMVPQNQLAEQWQRLEQLNKQLGQPDPQSDQAQRALSPPIAQATQGTTQQNAAPEQGPPSGSSAQSAAASGNSQPMPDRMSAGGSPGNARGGPPQGAPTPRLGPDGKPLEVQSQIGDRFPGSQGSDSQQPSVLREGKTDAAPASPNGQTAGPISVPAENVFVPGDRRPTVRDYFSKGSGGQ